MTDIEYKELLESLIKATKEDKISWQHESNGQFKAKIGDGFIGIAHSSSSNVDYAALSMYNSNNQLIDSVTYDSLMDEERYDQLKGLYDLINDKVFRITATKSSIFSALKGLVKN